MMDNRPSILEVVGRYVALHKAGKQMSGLCPFHRETTPSFSVNEDKGVFHCFGCQAGGDVVEFIMRLEGLTFPQACKALGIARGEHTAPRVSPNRNAAALLAGWLNGNYLKVGAMLRELSQEIALADSIPDIELVESLKRQWEILAGLHEDLQNPELAAELWESRAAIEALTADVEAEPLPYFPPLTPEYVRRLEDTLRC